MYKVRVCPETTSPWLNPNSADHVTGLTAVLSTATTAPFDSSGVRASIGSAAGGFDVLFVVAFGVVFDVVPTSLPTNHDTLSHVFR
jgi:hypothetical protein